MKKLIRICALLSLVFTFSIVSAHAQQTVKQYEAKIPFDFNVGQKSYQAGNYVIKISRLAANGLVLSLEDEKSNKLQMVMVSETESVTKNSPQLLFDVRENQRYLTKIITQDVGVSIGKRKSSEKNSSAAGPAPGSKPQTAAATALKK
ncbi:MAG: hypothetical protein M3384_09905 [Acidobacteriota bacterium]|nr:hypothetical protein [Acidobacteriota bacterium]